MPFNHNARRVGVGIGMLIAALTTGLQSSAAAQGTIRLDRGTRVRVDIEEGSRSVVATLLDVKTDTLVLGRTYGSVEATMPFALEKIRKLEVYGGKRMSLAPFGALGGMLLGGALVGAYNGIISSQCFQPRPCGDKASVWLGIGVGGVVGGVSMWFVRPDRWIEIALPRRAEQGNK